VAGPIGPSALGGEAVMVASISRKTAGVTRKGPFCAPAPSGAPVREIPASFSPAAHRHPIPAN
jgi:hypothetical protein